MRYTPEDVCTSMAWSKHCAYPPGGFQQGDGGRRGRELPQPLHTPGRLLRVQRFDQIIRGLHGKALHGIVPFGGGEDDGQARFRFPDLLCHFYAVPPAQKDVQKQPVAGFRAVMRQKILPAGIEGQVHALPMPGTVGPEQLRQPPLVHLQILDNNQMQKNTSFLLTVSCKNDKLKKIPEGGEGRRDVCFAL